jgi:hypothetical protein
MSEGGEEALSNTKLAKFSGGFEPFFLPINLFSQNCFRKYSLPWEP